ncbi:MAG: substrate-binding domain-containing protein [Clostridia bacterium]|nr:substrate-binding domain-containing protein [Clostridia bacterium]
MKYKGLITLLIVLLLFNLTSCEKEKTVIEDDGIIKIGFISETFTVERWKVDRDIFVAKAKELGAEVIVQNAYENTDRQIKIARDMIEQGVDALVIIAYEKDALSEVVKYAHDNNVLVIAYDRLMLNANVDLYISFDNYEVGNLMAETITAVKPEGNYLVLNGAKTDNNAYIFRDGYINFLTKEEKINIVEETWIEAWRDEVAYNFVTEYLKEGKPVDAIIAANDRVADGAIRALSEYQLAGEIPVTGQDAELAACRRIVEGTQLMTVYKPISVLATGAAEAAVNMVKGKKLKNYSIISDGTYDIKYVEYTPIAVTIDNMATTIIEDGVYTIEQVYKNIPVENWPKQ